MLIDHPEVGQGDFPFRRGVSDPSGADEIFTGLAEKMDDYAARYGEIADQAWEKEFCGDAGRPAKQRCGNTSHDATRVIVTLYSG